MTIDTMIITTHTSHDRYLFDFHKIKSANYYKKDEPQKF